MSHAELEVLSLDECLALLRGDVVGRVAVVDDMFPVVLPVNYKLVETRGPVWVAIRTRPENVIDHPGMPAAFEIDGYSITEQEGWSVLVRGTLDHVDPDRGGLWEGHDPQPWFDSERDAWLAIEPVSVTGRRLRSPQPQWAFHLRGYL
jgi:Pyridoxamine 5'-phosphate oxidase